MLTAVVDGRKLSPVKNRKGECAYCGGEMIAQRNPTGNWNWVHQSEGACDSWCETDTAWRIEWMRQFPVAFREVIDVKQGTNQKHFADVKTDSGLVVVFRNNPFIRRRELIARERFFDSVVWIVNCTSSEEITNIFYSGLSWEPTNLDPLQYHLHSWGLDGDLGVWADANSDVLFDFGDQMHLGTEFLWHLDSCSPISKSGKASVVSRKSFVRACIAGTTIPAAAIAREDAWLFSGKIEHLLASEEG